MDREDERRLLDVEVDTSASRANVCRPVVGEIICDDVLESKEVISCFSKAWKDKSYRKVRIINIKHNKYLFECDSAETALEVIRNGPWIIMGHFLCLEYWETEEILKEAPLSDVRIWVQVHGLEKKDLSDDESMEIYIGDHIGEYLEADSRNHRHIVKYGFIRIKVRMNCYAIIKAGMWIYKEGKRKIRVDFKYEGLAEMCYKCGHLGHSTGSCKAEDHPNPQLGPWLRAKPISFKNDEYIVEDCKEKSIKLPFYLISAYLGWRFFSLIMQLLASPTR